MEKNQLMLAPSLNFFFCWFLHLHIHLSICFAFVVIINHSYGSNNNHYYCRLLLLFVVLVSFKGAFVGRSSVLGSNGRTQPCSGPLGAEDDPWCPDFAEDALG